MAKNSDLKDFFQSWKGQALFMGGALAMVGLYWFLGSVLGFGGWAYWTLVVVMGALLMVVTLGLTLRYSDPEEVIEDAKQPIDFSASGKIGAGLVVLLVVLVFVLGVVFDMIEARQEVPDTVKNFSALNLLGLIALVGIGVPAVAMGLGYLYGRAQPDQGLEIRFTLEISAKPDDILQARSNLRYVIETSPVLELGDDADRDGELSVVPGDRFSRFLGLSHTMKVTHRAEDELAIEAQLGQSGEESFYKVVSFEDGVTRLDVTSQSVLTSAWIKALVGVAGTTHMGEGAAKQEAETMRRVLGASVQLFGDVHTRTVPL